MISRPLQLDVSHVDVLFEHLGVQERPYPFEVPYQATERAERQQQFGRVFADLQGAGLARPDGQRIALDPDLAAALSLLARPALSLDAIFLDNDEPVPVLVASDGRNAVRGVQRGAVFRLHPVPPEALAEAVVELLPPVGACGEQSVQLSADDLHDGRAEPSSVLVSASAHWSRPVDPHEVLRGFLATPRTGGGQVSASSIDQMGKRRRSPTLNWQDQGDSRTLITTDGGGLTLTRVDQARLAGRLRALLDGVQSAPAPAT